jgi:hypothetical protein
MHTETDEEVRAMEAARAREAARRGAFVPKPRTPVLDYTIVTSDNLKLLQEDVRTLLKGGWTPLGGVTNYMWTNSLEESYPMFVQAMVLRS